MAGVSDALNSIFQLLTTAGHVTKSPGKVKLKKFPGGTVDWVSFPWGDEKAMQALTQSQYGLEYIGELICMGNRLQKVNKMSEMPGKTSLPGLAKKPERFWSENPISKARWQSGEVALRVTFSESPRTNIVIANKSDRTIRVGSRREVHLGGPESSFNLSQRYIATEELQQNRLAHTVTHHACEYPVELKKEGKNFESNLKLFNHSAEEKDLDYAISKLKNCGSRVGEGDIGVPQLGTRDVRRDDQKHRTQVWSRYEGVTRWEAVKTKPNPSVENYEGDLDKVVNQTPIFSDDSPQALFEIRPAEFTTEKKAAMIMATPTFVLCGMENPGIDNYSLQASADKWVAGGTEQATDDNFFAVRDKKNYKKNWDNILPSGRPVTLPLASYGILGGTRTIEVKTEDKPLFQGQSGLELFGENVVSIGSGLKKDGKWTSGLIVKDDIVELRQSDKDDDQKKSFISMQSELLELRNEVANLKSMIRIDKEGITLSVGNTAIEIMEHRIQIFVKGALTPVATFDEKEFKHGKQVNRVSL